MPDEVMEFVHSGSEIDEPILIPPEEIDNDNGSVSSTDGNELTEAGLGQLDIHRDNTSYLPRLRYPSTAIGINPETGWSLFEEVLDDDRNQFDRRNFTIVDTEEDIDSFAARFLETAREVEEEDKENKGNRTVKKRTNLINDNNTGGRMVLGNLKPREPQISIPAPSATAPSTDVQASRTVLVSPYVPVPPPNGPLPSYRRVSPASFQDRVPYQTQEWAENDEFGSEEVDLD